MWDKENDKLDNIMRLKQELEKDLKKRGLLKEKKTDQKQQTVDETTMKRLREAVTVSAHIVEERSLTPYDINAQDYDAGLDDVMKTLKVFFTRTDNLQRKTVFDGLIKLLTGDLRGAVNTFSQSNLIEARYNHLLAKLYSGEDVSQELAKFLKDNPDSIYPILLLLQNELHKGRLDGVEKILQVLAKKSKFWELVYTVFCSTATEDQINNAIRERIFASLVVLLSVYVDPTREYPIQSHTCLNVHKAFLRGETVQAPNWCPFGVVAMEARRYLSGYRPELDRLRKLEKYPEAKLLLGFIYYNEGSKAIAKDYFERFESQIQNFDVYLKPSRSGKIGIEQFTKIVRFDTSFEKVTEKSNIIHILEGNPQKDIYVVYKNLEFVRLVFSEEYCAVVNK
uniref:Uncharacterized protein n=1 Tax=Fervidobacterium thailandense TaxID=1008305 RepID=A0A7C5VJJ9_9BACT